MSAPVQTDLEDAIAAASIETELFLDGKVELRKGDCRDVLRSIPDNSIDSVVTDPPYALVSIVKRFGGENAAPAKSNGATGVYARASSGFMGKTWDTGETAFAVDFWAEVLRVLKPGGHVVAFSGARTYHRMVCAIEDAGFEIRDQIMWVYGSGFPKSLDVSKAIDKAAGEEREVVGRSPYASNRSGGRDGTYKGRDEYRLGSVSDITAPTTEAAKQWQGWGTSLKPANEPICLARKPLIGTVAANVITHGTGALNIDGCRVEAAGRPLRELDPKPTDSNVYVGRTGDGGLGKGLDGGSRAVGTTDVGRFPANLIHDGSEEVVSMFPDAGASAPVLGSEASKASIGIITGERQRVPGVFHADTGSASRFFYSAKADADDRLGSKHPTVKPVDLMQYLVRLVTRKGGTVLDPFSGTGTTGEAAWREGMRAILIEREPEYQADISRRMELAANPTKRAAVAKTKNNLDDPNDLPLFSGNYGEKE
jgi:site-specific DNA-methyltransferase (adenine-specific)